jgi:Ca-activated chloride channel family protein
MRTLSSLLLSAGLLSCSTAREASISPEHVDREVETTEPQISEEEREELEADLDEEAVHDELVVEAKPEELRASEEDSEPVVDATAEEAQAAAETGRRVHYKQRTEIDFEGLDVSGELVKPQGELLLERKRVATGSISESQTIPPMSADAATGVGTRGRGGGASGYGSGGGSYGGSGYGGGGGGSASTVRRAPPTHRYESVEEPRATSDQFTDHGVNPFTLVEDDALSTFSIDVDTASYAIARRHLNSGALPPYQAVRVEEFVNSVDYDYAAPEEGAFSVHMEAMPDPFRDGHQILRVGVKAKEIPPAERPPVHLSFLVDVSGSMSSYDKLGLAKESLKLLVDHLGPEDTVGLATYAGQTSRVLEPTPASDKATIKSAIDGLSAAGSTAMSSGIDIAYDMASKGFVSGHENRVLILSDGDANIGATSWDQMLTQIKGHANNGITLSTIGFGMGNYQDTLMEQLADHGDGQSVYIDGEAEARKLFVEQQNGSLITVARDTKIQVEFDPASVRAYRLIGYENRDIADADFRNDRVDAGEVGSGHDVTALYQVLLRDDYERNLATVRVRWEQPGPDSEATERSFSLSSRKMKETPELASSDLRIAYSAATLAEVLRQSPHASEISLSQLAIFARAAARSGEKSHAELVGLIERAEAMGAGNSGVAAH